MVRLFEEVLFRRHIYTKHVSPLVSHQTIFDGLADENDHVKFLQDDKIDTQEVNQPRQTLNFTGKKNTLSLDRAFQSTSQLCFAHLHWYRFSFVRCC